MTFDREVWRKRRQYTPIHWTVRHMRPDDDAAYHNLLKASPELGLVSIEVKFKEGISPFEVLTRKQGQQVFIAEIPEGMADAGKVIGSAACDPRMVWFHEKPTQAVHLHSLLVHADYRHQGIATTLLNALIHWSRQQYGAHVLIFAEIQQDDMAAFKNAAKWATDFTQPLESGFLPARKSLPHNPHGYVVREAAEPDYDEIVRNINEFNHDVDFTRVVDSDRLHRNLTAMRGYIFRHRYVVLENNQIVGGAVLSEHDPSIETRVVRAPLLNRTVAQLTGMIHTDGEIKGGEVDGIWFKHGHQDATHYLVQYLLHAAHESKEPTEALNFTVYNPKAWEAVQVSHWQPHTILCVAYLYNPPTEMDEIAAAIAHASA